MYCSAPSAAMSNRLSPSWSATGPSAIWLSAAACRQYLRIGFSHTGAIFLFGLAESALTGAEVVVHKAGGSLHFGTSGQLATRERAPRRDPQVTPLVAQRVLEEQRAIVQQLLYVDDAERLHLCQRGITRTLGLDLVRDLFVGGRQRNQLLVKGSRSFPGMFATQQPRLPFGRRIELLLQRTLALEQRLVDALPNVCARLGKQVDQASGAGAFACLQRFRLEPSARAAAGGASSAHQRTDS